MPTALPSFPSPISAAIPAQAYFSDGIAEELRSALSRIAGLTVVARTSSEMLRDADAKTAARKLGVANMLTGSVRQSPSTDPVNAQLIDGRNGMERWSQSFDRPFGDVLQIQTGIAESVAQALSIQPCGRGPCSIVARRNSKSSRPRFILPGKARANSPTPKLAPMSRWSSLDAAIALDPNFAEAHARKAIMLSVMASVYALSATEAQARQQASAGFGEPRHRHRAAAGVWLCGAGHRPPEPAQHRGGSGRPRKSGCASGQRCRDLAYLCESARPEPPTRRSA